MDKLIPLEELNRGNLTEKLIPPIKTHSIEGTQSIGGASVYFCNCQDSAVLF
jgi:hypothetical protein